MCECVRLRVFVHDARVRLFTRVCCLLVCVHLFVHRVRLYMYVFDRVSARVSGEFGCTIYSFICLYLLEL